MLTSQSHKFHILSAEDQKGDNAFQRCTVENQKGAISMDFQYSDSALLVLNKTSLNSVNAVLALI